MRSPRWKDKSDPFVLPESPSEDLDQKMFMFIVKRDRRYKWHTTLTSPS